MWQPAGKALDRNDLGSLEPAEVLFEYDGEPLTFVANGPELLLVHSLCVFDRTSRYLVAGVDASILQNLKEGRIDILGALKQPRCWVADVAEDAAVRSIWQVDFSTVPEWVLPQPDVLLRPELDPLRALRFTRDEVGHDEALAVDRGKQSPA